MGRKNSEIFKRNVNIETEKRDTEKKTEKAREKDRRRRGIEVEEKKGEEREKEVD